MRLKPWEGDCLVPFPFSLLNFPPYRKYIPKLKAEQCRQLLMFCNVNPADHVDLNHSLIRQKPIAFLLQQ